MNDALQVAIAKIIAKDLPELATGSYEIDQTVTLHVKGTVKKGADCEYTPTVSVPLKATVALLLNKMGFQRDRAAELLVEAMTEALEWERLGEETIVERLADVDAAMERVQQITAQLPKQLRKGATTVKGTVVVEVVAEPVSEAVAA